jgi:hypothetical protein
MKIDVKPLTHWAIYKGCKLRFRSRTPASVSGVLTSAEGTEMTFDYAPDTRTLQLPGERIRINEYGWEVDHWTSQ